MDLTADDESTGTAGLVAIGASLRRDELIALAVAAGWRVEDDDDATIRIVDLSSGETPSATWRDRSAVVVIAEDAEAAYAAGATQWLAPGWSADIFAAALRFAGRYARRLRRLPYEAAGRRAGDLRRGADHPLLAWIETRVGSGAVSAIVIALTRFEFVNAAFGRDVGDELMAATRARIERWAQDSFDGRAVIARRAGAEFVVLAQCGGAAIIGAVDRLEAELARPFEVQGAAVNLGSRVGLAESLADDSASALLRRAQDALGEARSGDGVTARFADADSAVIDRLAADLHHAFDRDEIEVVFQPQVAMTGSIVGVEALARWQHPELGALGADQLFAAAERADLGIALSDHIQRVALDRAAAWPATLDRLRLSINVTSADLARPGFTTAFLDRIAASGFARARVTVEIVETGLMGDLDRAAAILARLRGAGCRIAIDDFGTGYSSLAYLKALPIDYLKIDRSLTRDITGSDRDRVIVRGVIAIARSLGLETIAEGVETDEERALLASEGCDLYQGFLCSEPVGSAELVGLVTSDI